MNTEKLRNTINDNKIEWRKHVFQRMLERNITRENIKEVICKGEMIEYYKDDKPFESALFFKVINSRPLHVVAAYDEMENMAHIITAYESALEIFKSDNKTRKKK